MTSFSNAQADAGKMPGLEFYFAYAGLFCTIISAVMTGLILFCRSGLHTPPLLVMAGASILMAGAFAPFLLPKTWRGKISDRYYIYPLSSLLMFCSPLLVWVAGHYLVYVYPLLALLGAFRSLEALKKMSRSQALFLVIVAPLTAVYVFFYFNQWNYAGVFAPEMALLGRLRKDTYYATVISHMIQNFGIPSTGLDGLTRLHYHTGSHTWFAALGKLAGQAPLFSYPVGLMTVAIPAQFLALFFAIICAAKNRLKMAGYFGLALALVFITDAMGRPSHYISESYGFAITALLFFLPLLLDIIAKPRRSLRDDIFRLLIVVVSVFVLNSLKISVGILWSAGLGYAVVRLYWISARNVATIPAMIFLQLLAFKIYNDPGQKAVLAPLQFFASHPRLLFLSCWLIPFLALGFGFLNSQIKSFKDVVLVFRTKTALGLEIVILAAFLGALPAFLLWISVGWAWFFFNVSQWLALPILFSYISIDAIRKSRYQAALYLAGLILLAAAGYKIPSHIRNAFDPGYLRRSRDFLQQEKSKIQAPEKTGDFSMYGPGLGSILGDYPGYKAYSLVTEAAAGQIKGFAVFAPPENKQFWTIVKNCVAQPMFIPSLTGRPMLFGLTPKDMNCDLEFYGYPDYDRDSHSRTMDDASLCDHARDKNIDTVFILRDLDDRSANRILNCRLTKSAR